MTSKRLRRIIKLLLFVLRLCRYEYLHAGVRKLVIVCKQIPLDSVQPGPAFKIYSSRSKTEGKCPKREHLTTLQPWTAAEAENRNPAFHIKLEINAWTLLKGCSFVCVTVLHEAQTKISSFFLWAQLAACQHGGCRPAPDQEYTLVFCYEHSFCFYPRGTTRFISSVFGAGVVTNAQNMVAHRKLTWMLAFPLLWLATCQFTHLWPPQYPAHDRTL